MKLVERAVYASPLGDLAISWTERGVCRLKLPRDADAETDWWKRWFGDVRIQAAQIPEAWRRELDEYFQGRPVAWEMPLDLRGTEFQVQVWRLLTGIPYGHTISYRELASRSSAPRGFRAVGTANGSNPVPIVVPCHRVVNADGRLGGYSSGLDFKRRLLALERGVDAPWLD